MDCKAHQAPLPTVFQARILEWVAIACSRASLQPRNRTPVYCMGRQILHHKRHLGSLLTLLDHPSLFGGFPDGSEGKASACNAGDLGLIPESGRSAGEGNGNPLQYSCLENPMDGRAW